MKTSTKVWSPIWSQAMAKAWINGRTYINKTSCFKFIIYMKGTSMRLRFSNVSGKSNVELDSITVWNKNVPYAVTLNDDRSIVIPKGDRLYSDVIRLPIEIEDEIEIGRAHV